MLSHEHNEVNRAIISFFDQLAERWDAIVCSQHAERLGCLIERLAIPPQSRILDVGSGTGVLLPFLTSPCCANRFVVPMDLSFNMIKNAVARSMKLAPSIACVQGDASCLPFGKGVFDWIVCNSVFPHFQDQAACVDQLAAALIPGGYFVVCHSQSRETINTFHRSHGGLIGGHELPEETPMKGLMSNANLTVKVYEDCDDHYLLVAVKNV